MTCDRPYRCWAVPANSSSVATATLISAAHCHFALPLLRLSSSASASVCSSSSCASLFSARARLAGEVLAQAASSAPLATDEELRGEVGHGAHGSARRGAFRTCWPAGSVMRNVVPLGPVDSTSTVPPLAV